MLPILKNEKEILTLMRNTLPPFSKDFLCFYSSRLKAIITDPLFMTVPLEDKIVHRGYAVFETTKIFENKIYQLDKHIDRFLKSINHINLTSMYSKNDFRDILIQLATTARLAHPTGDIELRYFYSAGVGNLSLIVNNDLNTFYAVALKSDNSIRPFGGTVDKLIYIDPIKKDISASKSTNYLVNALITKKSRESGGYLGIMVDENGHILESPISNIAFVFKNGEYNVPSFEKTLIGTTVIRVLEHVEKVLMPEGLIKGISREYLHVDNISENVVEAMFVGGDFVIPILMIDNITISSQPGKITKMLQEFLASDKSADDGGAEEIPGLI